MHMDHVKLNTIPYDKWDLSFDIKTSDISMGDFLIWKKADGDPIAFFALRFGYRGFGRAFEFGYCDSIEGWKTASSPIFYFRPGRYHIRCERINYLNLMITIYINDVVSDFFYAPTSSHDLPEYSYMEYYEDPVNVGISNLKINETILEKKEIYKNKNSILVTLSNDNVMYLDGAKSVFYSARQNGWTGDMMLLSYEVSEKNKKMFEEKGIFIHECSDIDPDFFDKIKDAKEKYFYSKLFLFQQEFSKWENILFVDADTVIIGDIGHLQNLRSFYAVPKFKLKNIFMKNDNFSFAYHDCDENENYEKLILEYDMDLPSIDGGFFAFNSSIIKNGDMYNDLLKLRNMYNGISRLPEEAILSLYWAKRNWRAMSCIYDNPPQYIIPYKNMNYVDWNRDYYFLYDNGLKIKIAHCLNPKPWEPLCVFHHMFLKNVDGFQEMKSW